VGDLGEACLLQDEGAVEKYNEEVPNQEHQNPLRGRKKKKEEEKKREERTKTEEEKKGRKRKRRKKVWVYSESIM